MTTRERLKSRMKRAENCEFCRFALYAQMFASLFGTKSLHLRNSLNFFRLNSLILLLKLIVFLIKFVDFCLSNWELIFVQNFRGRYFSYDGTLLNKDLPNAETRNRRCGRCRFRCVPRYFSQKNDGG